MSINLEHNIKSDLQLQTLYVDSYNFKFLGSPKGEIEVNVNFNVEDTFADDILTISLSSYIMARDRFELNVTLVGQFVLDAGMVDKLKANAVAVMFPYLRSQVTLLTTQPNISPIVLPTININKLLQYHRK